MGRWANNEEISAMLERAEKRRALDEGLKCVGEAYHDTYKNITPPRLK
jgi:hypothetical protein